MKVEFNLVQGERNTYGLEVNNKIFTNAPKGGVLRHIRSFDIDMDVLETELNKIKERRTR